MTSLVIIGSTGSIGRSALEVVEKHLPDVRIIGLAAGKKAESLAEQILRHRPKVVSVSDPEVAERVSELIKQGNSDKNYQPEVLVGIDGLKELARMPQADTVLVSVAGSIGTWPAWEAVRAGKRLALATKEALVLLGDLLMTEAEKCGAEIIPVDSEHSALFQLLRGTNSAEIKSLWLGASGGPFREADPKALDNITPAEALAHPVWKMGPKVTVDSATLMNKGLEIIEARWLFDVPQKDIKVVIHPQGLVHAMVELVDGSILMHAGLPDMKAPIAYAISHPERAVGVLGSLDLAEVGMLIFEQPSVERFPCLGLARKALDIGGTAPTALNAADEVAVEAFLEEKIPFTAIPRLIETVLDSHKPDKVTSPEVALDADRRARERAWELVGKFRK